MTHFIKLNAHVCNVKLFIFLYLYVFFFRIRQETKHLNRTYSTMEKDPLAYYRPVTIHQSTVNGTDWNNTLPPDLRQQITSYPDQCTCATLQMRAGEDGNHINGDITERQDIYNSIKSQ